MAATGKRDLYEKFSTGVVYLETRDAHGSTAIGSAFHVGDNIYVTARHVVESRKVVRTGGIQFTKEAFGHALAAAKADPDPKMSVASKLSGQMVAGPYFHPDPRVDVAALRIEGIAAATLEIGGHLDDWIGTEFVLTAVLLMGYPRVPFAADPPILVAASGEVNAVVDLYNVPNARFVISQMARGGFSGGPVISAYGFVLGVVTDSLVEGQAQPETGFCSAISVEPILECLHRNGIMPEALKQFWHESGLFQGDDAAPPTA